MALVIKVYLPSSQGRILSQAGRFLNHVRGWYGRPASLIFLYYPLSWLYLSLSFEISVGANRIVAILHHLWIKPALFSWIRPFDGSCENGCSSGSVGYWQVLEEWVVGLCQLKESPAFVGMCSTWTWSGRVISRRSAATPEPDCSHGAQTSLSYLCRCGSWLHGGRSCSHSSCAAPKGSSPDNLIVSMLVAWTLLLRGCAWGKSLK